MRWFTRRFFQNNKTSRGGACGLIVVGVLAFALLFAFQNCAPHFISHSDRPSESVADTVVQDADLAWSMRRSQPVTNGTGQVERWMDALGLGINLYPPQRANSTMLALELSPTKTLSNGETYLHFAGEQHLQPSMPDFTHFASGNYTIFFLLKDVVLPLAGTSTRVFLMAPSSSDQAGTLALDFGHGGDGTLFFSATFWTDASSYAVRVFPMNQLRGLSAHQPLAIGVRFGQNFELLEIAINGKLSLTALTQVGSPAPLGNVSRHLLIHPPGGNKEFLLGEFGIYKRTLSNAELVSSTYVMQRSWGGTAPKPDVIPDDQETSSEYRVLAGLFGKPIRTGAGSTSTCTGCHAEFFSRTSLLSRRSADGVLWVTPSNSAGSRLVQSLRKQAGVMPMPTAGGQMSEEDIQTIEAWISRGAL